MTSGIILLNFGEPADLIRDNVVAYLERIFLDNAALNGEAAEQEARERAQGLAEQRAPALMDEYERIGGSPLNQQAERQATALEAELRRRGFDVNANVGMQFTDPLIKDVVERMQADEVEQMVGLPVYPLCGPSTTIATLEELNEAANTPGWNAEFTHLTGWHRHPTYIRMRAENIRSFAIDQEINLEDQETEFLFSAHGTPQYYLDRGSHYVDDVEEWCRVMAAKLGVCDYTIGYQNHEQRDIEWTKPEVERVLAELGTERVVVEPISFMHEQSETLLDLDTELHELANGAGIDFYRIPIPHDDERFPVVLADLVEPFVAGIDPDIYHLRPCECTETMDAWCLNCSRAP